MATQSLNTQSLLDFQQAVKQMNETMTKITQGVQRPECLVERAEAHYESAAHVFPRVYRFFHSKERFYFTHKANDAGAPDVTFFPSCTTVIRNTTPTSFGILRIMQEHGSDYDTWLRRKADYGTFLHFQFADYMRLQSYDFDLVEARRLAFSEKERLEYDNTWWTAAAKRDLLGLIQFVRDYNVTPLFVEQPITYTLPSGERFGSVIDLVCEMDIEEAGFWGETYKSGEKKGEPKETKQTRRIIAAIDLKSGKSGFFDDHAIQLKMYQMALEQSGFPVERIYNLAPSDWKETPSYKLKDQTEEVASETIALLLRLYFLRSYREPSPVMVIVGSVNGHELMNEIIRHVPAREYALRRVEELSSL